MKTSIMNIRLKYALPAIMAVAALTSCGDFLKETSQDEFEPKTTVSFAELLQGQGYNFFGTTLDGITALMCDDAGTYNTMNTLSPINIAYKDAYTWQPYMYETIDNAGFYGLSASAYENLYSRIMICNMITELVPGSKGTQEEKDQVIGEALTLRAFYYLQLVNLFAKPYNDKRTTPENSPGVTLALKSEVLDTPKPRNTVAEVYAQITKDVERAIELLEAHRQNNGVFRIGHTAARLLASRVYLYMENWDKVIEHSTKALESAPGLCYIPDYVLTNYMNPTNGVISKSFPETIHVFSGHLPAISFFVQYNLSADFITTFAPNDQRRGKYFFTVAWGYSQGSCKAGNSEMGYVWRTAELYLNRAEAYMMKYRDGNAASGQLAVNDLNTLLANRYLNYTDHQLGTAAELEALCKEERRKELFFEGQRWFDLRRFGMPRIEHIWWDDSNNATRFVLEEGDPAYVLPIPQKAMERNNKLVQNEPAPVRQGTAI